MAIKTPLVRMKERFGEKAKLVEAVKAFVTEDLWLGRTAADRGKERGLDNVSNAKLLRLYETFSQVKQSFGTRAKLIDAILDVQKRTKDAGMKKRLDAYPVPRLYDLYKSSARRAGVAFKPAAAAEAPAAPAKAAKAPKTEKAEKAEPKKKATRKKAAEP